MAGENYNLKALGQVFYSVYTKEAKLDARAWDKLPKDYVDALLKGIQALLVEYTHQVYGVSEPGTVEVHAAVGLKGEPFITLRVPQKEMQIETVAALEIAANLNSCVEQAMAEAFLMNWFMAELGVDQAMTAQAIQGFRKWRQAREFEAEAYADTVVEAGQRIKVPPTDLWEQGGKPNES